MRVLLIAVILIVVALVGAGSSFAQTAGTAVVALGREPDRLYNPSTVSGQLVANLVFDPLVGLDDQMNPYPVLAESIPSPDNSLVRLSGDGGDRRLIVTMPLRQGVTWADGEPFTADDVVYTWQLMMNPQSGFDTTVEDKLKSVDKVDDYTVQFTYLSANEARALDPARYKNQGDQPVVDSLYMFGLYDAPAIYPRHKLRDIVGDDPRHSRQIGALETSEFARNPVGTGPYTLASWDASNTITFTSRGQALPQRLGKPALDTIVFRVVPDKNDSLTALSQGQVQVVTQDGLDAGDALVLDTLAGARAYYTPGNAWEHLTFNLDNPILADPNVRQAIAAGIDRATLNDSVLLGKAEVAVSQVPSWSWAFDATQPHVEYNPGQAQQLLDRAGWTRAGADPIRSKGGQRLSLKYWSAPASFRGPLMATVKDELAQIGIEVNTDIIPSATLFDSSAATPQALASRQFDIAEFAWVSGYDAGADALYNMHSSSVPSRTNGFAGGNFGDYKNPRNDQLLDQAQVSLDPSFRRIALLEAQTIWQSDLPVLPLLLRPVTTATSTRLTNYRPTPAPAGETWNVEQWDFAPAAP
ncbi:MAG TPA: peptide ABC transporter substrate-binding protein [Chloroflexota bacterium]|nr:peptide ABC transporter substrate-binding protein [Chloroflexota bacterium]